MRRRLIPVLLLVASAAVACGDDESVFDEGSVTTAASTSTGAETTSTGGEVTTSSTAATTTTQAASTTMGGGAQDMADQIAAALVADAEPGTPIDEESAQCLGNQLVATFGVERLQELEATSGGTTDLGAAFEQMTPEELSTLTGVILNGSEGQAACIDMRTYLVDSMSEAGLSAGSAECVADGFLQGTIIQDFIVAALGNPSGESEMDPEAATQLLSVMMGCLTPEELANLGDIDLGT